MAKASLDEQLAQAEERKKRADARYKRLQQKKQLVNAKKAIAENKSLHDQLSKQVAETKSLNEQLKNKNVESLSNARDYKQVMDAVKQLFDDVQQKKLFNLNYKDDKQQNHAMIKSEDVMARLQKIINLQK